MNAYIWQYFQGDRGQNNITSCLLMDLKIRGWLSTPNHGELTYIDDNCGGQNKNICVVRFLMWLVKEKIFPRVTLLFLVKGHTKSSADRMFNLLKLTYHCPYIFSYDELHSVLSENEFLNVIKMAPSNFYDHLKGHYKHYRVPERVNFNTSNLFFIYVLNQGSQPTMLTKQDDKESPLLKDSLIPTPRNNTSKKLNPA